ncbi:MAG: SDR family oxidoreductase [Hyphomonas sp.]
MGVFSGKTVLVTGAANGMGRAEAERFAEGGANVVLTDISEAGAEAAAAIGEAALFVLHDVTSEDSWRAAIAAAEGAFGPIDILVNNAGAFVSRSITESTAEDFDRITHVNQLGVMLGMKCAAASMQKKGGGVIINISSLAGFRTAPNTAIYSASKWAVRALTRVAVAEFAPLNIRVNSVHPGAIDTRLLDLNPPGFNEMVAEMTPAKRLGTPEDVARAVCFLASDEAAFINGAELVIDGGLGIV